MKKWYYLVRLKLIAIIRRVFERALFRPQKNWEELEDICNWLDVRELDGYSFGVTINGLQYQPPKTDNPLRCPFPIDSPQYFFKALSYGREGDAWARIWTAYWLYHDKVVEEWLIASSDRNYRHSIAIVRSEQGYGLCDFEFKGYFPTIAEALNAVELSRETNGIDKFIAVKYRTWSK